MLKSKFFHRNKIIKNSKNVIPSVSFYSLKANTNKGDLFDFKDLKGKHVLIVNTASDCGYTAQYKELQRLFETYQNKLIILAFPSNDFKEQEKLSDEAIKQFCDLNYGVTFLLMKKTIVVKKASQNEVYQWLTNASQNGWNDQQPAWNFCKYFISDKGVLEYYFDSSVSPFHKAIIKALK
jgi:glutathione peroxidase